MGESDDGTLTPFQEDLESDSSDSESTLVTSSFDLAPTSTGGEQGYPNCHVIYQIVIQTHYKVFSSPMNWMNSVGNFR